MSLIYLRLATDGDGDTYACHNERPIYENLRLMWPTISFLGSYLFSSLPSLPLFSVDKLARLKFYELILIEVSLLTYVQNTFFAFILNKFGSRKHVRLFTGLKQILCFSTLFYEIFYYSKSSYSQSAFDFKAYKL